MAQAANDPAASSERQRAIEKKKCITPEFRISFPNLFEPKSFKNGEPKCSLTMLFPKTTDLAQPAQKGKDGKPIGISLKHAVYNAAVEKWGPKEKWPEGLRLPFRDGNKKSELEGYADTIFCTASSKRRPGVVNPDRTKVINPEEVYAGCYCRAEVIAFAYDTAGNKGVGLSLQNVQKLRDGEEFSGRKKAEDVFDAVIEVGADDPANYNGATNELGF